MALANYSDYVTKKNAGYKVDFVGQLSASASRIFSSKWLGTPYAGTAPTTAGVPNNTTVGNILGQWGLGAFANSLYLCGVQGTTNSPVSSTSMVIIDRLSHQGGLSGIVTSAQTTNLPTAALTRYTTGVGVMIAIEIYTTVGTTGTTITASYTNQSGTAGRTTKAVVFGATGARELGCFILLPLQDGDTGCRSVESVTVLATTGTAGAFGVTLFKPLMVVPGVNDGASPFSSRFDSFLLSSGPPLIEVEDTACLSMLGYVTNTLHYGVLEFLETS